ncbi:MAG: sigma 54-interacting transcriptional regulator [Chitinispirillia bacterium]|jgi:PAS domain S-box-containing protein
MDITKKILDSITEGIFTIDTEFNITAVNKSAVTILGLTQEDVLGKKCYDIFKSSLCETGCPLEKSMKSGKPVYGITGYLGHSSGQRVPVSINTSVILDDNNSIIGCVETFRDMTQVESLKKELHNTYDFHDIISKSSKMHDIFAVLPDIAQSDSIVVIEGESGTGKELIAKAIHSLSSRNSRKLVAVNCGALPDNLLESELFGYVAGAFTDAKKDKPGRFAIAEGGTLFLDEIGEISPAMQVKLLRILQEKEYEPLGSTKQVKTNVRIIVATNKNLSDLVKDKLFRADLFYRLNVVSVSLPKLCERKEDIPLLVNHFIKKFNNLKSSSIKNISPEALSVIMQYNFPGNVRELENAIEYAFIMCHDDTILPGHLPETMMPKDQYKNYFQNNNKTLYELEKNAIFISLERNNWEKSKTASELGINKSTLWRKLKKFGFTI